MGLKFVTGVPGRRSCYILAQLDKNSTIPFGEQGLPPQVAARAPIHYSSAWNSSRGFPGEGPPPSVHHQRRDRQVHQRRAIENCRGRFGPTGGFAITVVPRQRQLVSPGQRFNPDSDNKDKRGLFPSKPLWPSCSGANSMAPVPKTVGLCGDRCRLVQLKTERSGTVNLLRPFPEITGLQPIRNDWSFFSFSRFLRVFQSPSCLNQKPGPSMRELH
jgi:hypothetical protein